VRALQPRGPTADFTIHDIERWVLERLCVRAAQRGHSTEEEARVILRTPEQASLAPISWRCRDACSGVRRT